MKYLFQFLIIIFISFVGEVLHRLIPLPIPASIYGIIILFTALQTRLLKVRDVKEVSTFLINIMPVMFVPAAVGLIDTWSLVRQSLLQYIIITVVSTFVVMGMAGRVTQHVIRRHKRQKENA